MRLLIYFIQDYFHFYPTVICITVVQLAQIPACSLLYGNEVTASLITKVVLGCFLQFFNLFFIHIVMTQVGMIFVNSETVRVGNEEILNNMKEGVVILHEENDQVLFANKAADKQFNVWADANFQLIS